MSKDRTLQELVSKAEDLAHWAQADRPADMTVADIISVADKLGALRDAVHRYLSAHDDPGNVFGLNQLAARIAFTNESHGWTIDAENVDRKLLLAVSEICEAQNELRDGHKPDEVYWRGPSGTTGPMGSIENGDKPEGFPVELADAMIHLLHVGNAFGIDIAAVIALKLKYNRLRPIKPGRIF